MRKYKPTLQAYAVALASMVGCSDVHPQSAPDVDVPSCMGGACLTVGSSAASRTDDIATSVPTSREPSGQLPVQQVCAADVIEAELPVVNLFVMMDRSGSMLMNGKWRHATGALSTLLMDPATNGLRVALRFFSDDAPMAGCTMQGCNVDACAEPLVDVGALSAEVGAADLQEQKLLAALSNTFPRSGLGTPIYPALGGALKWAGVHQSEQPTEHTAVVFVTDGEPNGCNESIDDISRLAADAYAAFNVRTYVIGLEGSNEKQLDSIAKAGNTERGIFIGASNHAEVQLLHALDEIRAQTMSCDFELPSARTAKAVDPRRVNVTMTHEGRSVELYQVDSASACTDDGASWYYDDPKEPSRIHLCRSTCDVARMEGKRLNVEVGCLETRRESAVVR